MVRNATTTNSEQVIANCFNVPYIKSESKWEGIVFENKNTLKMYNCYVLTGGITSAWPGCLINRNNGTVELHKCYYLKTQDYARAVKGIDDTDLDVEGVTSISEITAAKLNANLSSIPDLGEDVELVEWIDGPDGYPILNLQLPLSNQEET